MSNIDIVIFQLIANKLIQIKYVKHIKLKTYKWKNYVKIVFWN
jgi:hypothetical protein